MRKIIQRTFAAESCERNDENNNKTKYISFKKFF